jgi:hypothetical protein
LVGSFDGMLSDGKDEHYENVEEGVKAIYVVFIFVFFSMVFYNLLQCNLPLCVTKEDVNFEFSKYGCIEEVEIIQKKKSYKLKSFAFVRYRDMNSTYAAVDDPYPPSFYDHQTDKSFVISFSSSFSCFIH